MAARCTLSDALNGSQAELYRGVMRARCYPYNMPGRWFHNMNSLVYCNGYTILISYLSHGYAMLAGRCADCAPVSFRLGRPFHRAF
jgi:hypothetical protein